MESCVIHRWLLWIIITDRSSRLVKDYPNFFPKWYFVHTCIAKLVFTQQVELKKQLVFIGHTDSFASRTASNDVTLVRCGSDIISPSVGILSNFDEFNFPIDRCYVDPVFLDICDAEVMCEINLSDYVARSSSGCNPRITAPFEARFTYDCIASEYTA